MPEKAGIGHFCPGTYGLTSLGGDVYNKRNTDSLCTLSLMSGIGSMLSNVIITVGMLFVKSIGMLCLCICAPFMLLAIIILVAKVHETKGVDLNTVTGAEWD